MAHYYGESVKDALEANWNEVQGTIAWAVKSALVKRGRFADLQTDGEETRKELEDIVRDKVVKAIHLSWDPDGGASPATFATTTAKFAALKAVDALVARQSRFGASLDEPSKADGGEDDSDKRTLSDITPDEVVSGGWRGTRRIHAEVDLRLIKEMLPRDDWAVFIRRYEAKLSNRDLAKELGWTEDKLRWFLKGYTKRVSRLLGVKRPEHS